MSARRGCTVRIALASIATAALAVVAPAHASKAPTPQQVRSLMNPPYDPALPPKGVPDGFVLVEGDIQVRIAEVGSRRSGIYGAFTTVASRMWPGGAVPYEFDANATTADREQALTAMILWESCGLVHFVPRAGEANYIHIQNSTGNNSQVGQVGGQQIVNIFNWDNLYIIGHELDHALGRYHEQSRLDRDNYIVVNYANVCATCCSGASCNSQFDKRPEGGDYGPYDFDSVMHYSQCSFSTDGNCPTTGATITVKPPYDTFWQSRIGQRDHFSYGDSLNTSFMYALSNWRFVDPGRGGADVNPGGFFAPWGGAWKGLVSTPANGILFIEPGTYSGNAGTFSTPMIVRAPNGAALIQ